MKLHEHPTVKDLCGGAAIAALARQGDEQRYQLITSQYSAKLKDCSFSFGGMLTHAQRMIDKENVRWGSGTETATEQNLNDFSACVQSSIVRHIETRVHRAILFCDQVKKPQWRRTLVGTRERERRRCRTTDVSFISGSVRWSVEQFIFTRTYWRFVHSLWSRACLSSA